MAVQGLLMGVAAVLGGQTTPPLGWNSWDCYQGNLNETGALAVAETMVKFLAPSGYDILTIDEFWYAGDCGATSKCIDDNGRPQPDVAKWPSSAGGKGFKPFADKIHAMGLRVGIHTLRGSVSAASLAAKSPILGTPYTVNDIATTSCQWNKNWYAVNTSHPGAQIWLDSVYGQYAEWGVDLIKNDCIFAINYEEDNIKGVSAAIAKTGRPTVYSLSPGGGDPPTEFAQAKAIANDVNIYRVTGDWHGGDLSYHFQIAEQMQPLINVDGLNGKSFPDLDMLNPYTNSSSDPDFRAQMTLWTIARSPLIFGADLRSADFTASDFELLTNPEVLAITKASTGNKPVTLASTDDYVVWTATSTTTPEQHYVAIVTRATSQASNLSIDFKTLGIDASSCTVRDLWARNTLGAANTLSTHLPAGPHYYGKLFSLSACA